MLHIHKQHANTGLYPAGSIKFSTFNIHGAIWDVGEIEAIIKSNNGTVDNLPGGLAFKTKPADSITTSSPETRMVIDANGKVGIGTTSPLMKLDVNGSIRLGYWGDTSRFIGFTQRYTDEIIAGIELESVNANGNLYSQNIHFRTHLHGQNKDRKMTVRYDGNVGIGTPNPTEKLHIEGGNAMMVSVKGPYGAFIQLTSDYGSNNNNVYYNGTNHYFRTVNGNTSTGTGNLYTNNLYSGSLSVSSGMTVASDAQFTGHIKFNNGNGNRTSTLIDLGSAYGLTAKTCGFGVKSDATITAKGGGGLEATSFNATSDYRVKENVQTISGDIYTVDGLRPVSYILKDSQQPHIGFIAHELQEHIPTAVKGKKDGEIMQTVNYNELIPILVKEIQDLKKEVRSLKKELIDLKN